MPKCPPCPGGAEQAPGAVGALWPTTSRKGLFLSRFSSHWMDLSVTTSVAYPGNALSGVCRPASEADKVRIVVAALAGEDFPTCRTPVGFDSRCHLPKRPGLVSGFLQHFRVGGLGASSGLCPLKTKPFMRECLPVRMQAREGPHCELCVAAVKTMPGVQFAVKLGRATGNHYCRCPASAGVVVRNDKEDIRFFIFLELWFGLKGSC